jgi:hypothetical protein
MEGVPPPEPEPQAAPVVVTTTTTTTTVVNADDKSFTTTTTVTVPAVAQAPAPAVPVPLGSKTISVDVAHAADVNGEAPSTPNSMTRSPFETVFDPAEYRTDESLREFLVNGGCSDCSSWDPDGFSQLRNELEKGEATLGLDGEGKVKRVVSVAKPVRSDLLPPCPSRLSSAPRSR